jgi:hypothetical protein
MRRLLLGCAASLAVYALLFGVLLGRPLGYGFIEQQIEAKLARGAAITGPKLVILAGSNGPYSHRCETIEAMLALPCVNAGVAVGIGLDYLFARWDAKLRPGDVVYMPMEFEQYTMSRTATRVGPDAAIMWRHDRATLARLAPDRWAGAVFSTDLRGALMAVIETAMVRLRVGPSLREATVGWTNEWGDHVGHTLALAAPNRAMLAATTPWRASADEIAAGYGAALIGAFTRRMTARGVRVIGGLATGFDDVEMRPETIAATRAVYEANGGTFLLLANRSLYPRIDFFDTAKHLNEPCQIRHSQAVAAALAVMLDRPLRPAPPPTPACPGEMAHTPALAYDPPHMADMVGPE